MKSLQLRGCKQIAEPRKYYFVGVFFFFFFFFGVCLLYLFYFIFFLVFVSHRLGIWVNSLHLEEKTESL